MSERAQLMHGDCLELMKTIPDGSVDMVLCDPPYGITANKWDTVIDLGEMWEQYDRIVKPNGAVLIFAQMPFAAELVMSNKKNFKYMLTWDKRYKVNFLNAKKQPLRVVENICVFYRKQCAYNPQMTKGKFRCKGTGGESDNYGAFKWNPVWNDTYYPTDLIVMPGVKHEGHRHPNEKPVPLLEYLIKTYSGEGETVLDNCMGSGSTGEACIRTGRRFIGIEKEEAYYKIAENRIVELENEELRRKE